jgi:hypothetical protein
MSASTIIVKGGFEGLGDPNLDEHMRTRDSSSKITDLELELSLPPAQKESPSKDSCFAGVRFRSLTQLKSTESPSLALLVVVLLNPLGSGTLPRIKKWGLTLTP